MDLLSHMRNSLPGQLADVVWKPPFELEEFGLFRYGCERLLPNGERWSWVVHGNGRADACMEGVSAEGARRRIVRRVWTALTGRFLRSRGGVAA